MPRTRKYANDAEKQAAYRARLTSATVLIDRRSQNLMIRRMDALHLAVHAAAKAGNAVALACTAASPETVIENLTRHFEDMAMELLTDRNDKIATGSRPQRHHENRDRR